VVLYSVPQTYIDDVTVVTEIDGVDGILKVNVRLNSAVSAQGDLQLKGGDATIAAKLDFLDGIAEVQLTVANAKFWSDKTPYLYDLFIQTEQDSYSLKVAIRTIRVQDNQILLNGKPVKLNGFGRHEDFIASGKGLNLPLLVKDYQLMR
jgi:beta-glucuronidase